MFPPENSEDLTLEEAKAFECCKHLTDDEIRELLDVIKVFTEIVYAVFAKKQEEQQENEESDHKLAA